MVFELNFVINVSECDFVGMTNAILTYILFNSEKPAKCKLRGNAVADLRMNFVNS